MLNVSSAETLLLSRGRLQKTANVTLLAVVTCELGRTGRISAATGILGNRELEFPGLCGKRFAVGVAGALGLLVFVGQICVASTIGQLHRACL